MICVSGVVDKEKKEREIKIDVVFFFFFLVIRRPPRSTQGRSSAESDVYERRVEYHVCLLFIKMEQVKQEILHYHMLQQLSLIHISEPMRLLSISYAVFCLKKKTFYHFYFLTFSYFPISFLLYLIHISYPPIPSSTSSSVFFLY